MTASSNIWARPMSESDRYVLAEIIKREQQNNASKSSPEKYFEIFSAEQILKKRDFDLDPEEVRSGIFGGSGDGGIDSLYLFVNGRLIREDDNIANFKDQNIDIELCIIQSKFKNSFSENAIQKLEDFTTNCLRLDANPQVYRKLYNATVQEAAERFRNLFRESLAKRPTLTIAYHYAGLADEVDQKVQLRAELLKEKCREYYSLARIEFDFVRAQELFSLYNRVPTKTLILKTAKTMPSSSFGTAYVCLVPLRHFYDFITDKGNLRTHIFESNVRAYQGEVSVNKDIAETLSNLEDEEFWWLNNGVTIIASKATGAGDDIAITDPMIVNGLQTSYKIHAHFESGKTEDHRTIMVRVIGSTNAQSIDKIIKATNNQTKIEKAYLHATETVHRKIEQALKSADLYYDRRKNYYRTLGVSASKIITLPYLSRSVAAILLQRPDDARARPTTIADRAYSSLFSEKLPVKLYIKCAKVMKILDEYLDSYNLSRTDKNNLIFYTAMFTVCSTLKMAKPKATAIADMPIEDVTEDIMDECFNTVKEIYDKFGANDRAAKGPRMIEELKKVLESKFIAPLRAPRVKRAQRR